MTNGLFVAALGISICLTTLNNAELSIKYVYFYSPHDHNQPSHNSMYSKKSAIAFTILYKNV